MHITAVPVHTPQQTRGSLRWLVRDITAQKQAEQQIRILNAELEQRVRERTAQLQASEDRYRRLVEGSPA